MKLKKILSIILILSMIISTVGCSSTTGTQQATPDLSESENAETSKGTKTSESSEDFEELNTDVVVVGAGGGGLSASIAAAQQGNNVILLEKLGVVGGTSAFTEGIFAIESKYQKEAGVELTGYEILDRAMEYHHWLADAQLTKAYFDKTADTIDWLEDLDVKFVDVRVLGTSPKTWHVFEGLGQNAMSILHQRATELGVKVMTETPGTELVMNGDKIVGIIAEKKDGTKIKINADVVILATGGFADNEEMINKYTPHNYDNIEAIGSPQRTGDGINMGMAVGADIVGMSTIMMSGGGLKDLGVSSQLSLAAGRSPFMWVNEQGERFADESIVFDFSFSGNAMGLQEKVFSIMDSSSIEFLETQGCIMGRGAYIPTGTKLTNLSKELEEQLQKGNPDVMVADTIEELAKLMDVDADKLIETIGTYNELVSNGEDNQYGKNPEFLQSVLKAPFHAFNLSRTYYTTVGGLKITTKTEVVNTEGNVIKGLYATGSDAGGLYGDSYDVGICAGSQEGFAINGGRMAAENATEYIKTLK